MDKQSNNISAPSPEKPCETLAYLHTVFPELTWNPVESKIKNDCVTYSVKYTANVSNVGMITVTHNIRGETGAGKMGYGNGNLSFRAAKTQDSRRHFTLAWSGKFGADEYKLHKARKKISIYFGESVFAGDDKQETVTIPKSEYDELCACRLKLSKIEKAKSKRKD